MLPRCSLLLLGSLLGCTGAGPAENPALPIQPPPVASQSARASVRASLEKPTSLELLVTDKAGRSLPVSIASDAFAGCLAGSEPGERGYVLFSVSTNDDDPSSRKVAESDGLSDATLRCIAAILAGHREPLPTAPQTFWYFSVGP